MQGHSSHRFLRKKTCFAALGLVLIFLAWPGWAYDFLDDLEEAFESHISNDFDRAIELYTKIIKSKALPRKNLSVIYVLRGEAQAEQGNCSPAIKDFTEAIRLRPEYAHAFYFRSNCYEYKGDYEKAWSDLEVALSIRPDKELYLNSRTLLVSLMGKDEEELATLGRPVPAKKISRLPPKARSGWKSALPEFFRSPWSYIKSFRERERRK
ncbi:MAG: hypothetical protein JRI85_10670 [Deltaproteobacteria bacterium]|nr:hypothetical protein [Deltaproteobacteria bacterium]